MGYPYYDSLTIVIYLIVGTLCMLSVKIARGARVYTVRNNVEGFSLLFIVLVLFATLRKVGLHLGGEDAQRYQEMFVQYFNHGAERFEDTDILFGFVTGLIRHVTDNPVIYRFFCYSFIATGYIVFINRFCPQGITSIPFICILIPYMRSFGSMRNTMSIALFLMCLVCFYDRKYFWCFVLAVASVLMHRLSAAILSFFPFFWIFKNFIFNAPRKRLLIFTVAFILVSYLLAVQLQKYIILFSIFNDDGSNDFWYLTNGQGKNILLNWPMYIVHVLLLCGLMLGYRTMPDTRRIKFLKIFFIYDIILMPATLVLGLWRFAEYFYISNLILWSVLIPAICKKFSKQSVYILKICLLLGFYGLLYIRLTREWQDLALMPYLFIWE